MIPALSNYYFAKSRSQATSSGIVVLKVGPNQKAYHVHKALLTHHSEYFLKALEGPWKEAEERTVTLEDVEPTVGMYMLFLGLMSSMTRA
jgi:hypothetical protein